MKHVFPFLMEIHTRNHFHLFFVVNTHRIQVIHRINSIGFCTIHNLTYTRIQKTPCCTRGQLVPLYEETYVWHIVPVQVGDIPSYYLIAIKAAQKNINIKYEIISDDALQKKYEKVCFFYVGVAAMMSAIILVAFFLFRKTVFACYMGYIVCISAWIVEHYGRLFPFVFPQLPVIYTETHEQRCWCGVSIGISKRVL